MARRITKNEWYNIHVELEEGIYEDARMVWGQVEGWLGCKQTSSALAFVHDVVQLMFSVFKTLTDQTVIVELKNDLCITGVLKSVDQYLNIRLDAIKVQNPDQHPHMMAVKNCFIRGSVVRYVQLPAGAMDTQLLEDATRREGANMIKK